MSESLDFVQTFGFLRAESEAPWLSQAFLPPREFGQMTGLHSILVIGGEGSGKTALEIQLKAYARYREAPCLLSASWRPQLSAEMASSNQVAEAFMAQAMDSLSFAFLQTVARSPGLYSSGPSWAWDFMLWFIQRYLLGDRQFHLGRLAEDAVADGLEVVTHLLSDTPPSLFPQSAPASILPHLTEAVKALGFQGVWVFLDGLDTLFHIDPDRLEQFLTSFLSTLEYFEDPAFAFKIIVSRDLGQHLQMARGVVTRRFKTYLLKWEHEELIHLVEKRVALTVGRENVSLGKFCKDEGWLQWLKQYAGDSPRGWLDLTRPILMASMAQGKSISQNEWLDIYRQSPPSLRLDLDAGRVFIGFGEVAVSAIGYQLLAYLYANRRHSCTKSELYQRVYKEFYKKDLVTNKGKGTEEKRETRSDWEGIIDTALWRLRQTVEWDKRKGLDPLYIVSKRGRGEVCLENTA